MLAVFLLSAALPYGGSSEPAQAWIDPWARIPAQDEALYSHAALRMAAGEDWLTPQFLGRRLLVKPPLVMWLSAASERLGWGLRTPHVAAAAGIATVVYAQAGPVGWMLLQSRYYWRERAGLLLMDDLLVLLYLLCLVALQRDPKLGGRGAPEIFGGLVGLAVMTKWFAGVLPLALLLWTRPAWGKWARVAAAAAVVALPWHLYQWMVNREWFLAEYIGVELLTYAVRAPVQATQEGTLAFYGSRMGWLLPCLVPAAWAYWRRSFSTVALVWCGVCMGACLAYGYHNASYLLPLAPALLLVPGRWLGWPFLLLAGLYAGGPGMLGRDVWEGAAPGRWLRGGELTGREVLHLDVNDQLRTSLAVGATVRYVLFLEHLPPNGPLDFEARGIAKGVQAFLEAPGAEVDVVLAPDLAAMERLILGSPERDFILPRKVWEALSGRVGTAHEVVEWPEPGKIRLRSRRPQAGPRPFLGFRSGA